MPKVLALDANNNTTEISLGDSIEWSLLTGVPVYATRWPTWDEVSGKPTAFTPAAHTHTITQVTGLQAALDGKAEVSHTHSISNITNLQTTLDAKADASALNTLESRVTSAEGAISTLRGYIDGLRMEWASGTSLRVTGGAAYVPGLNGILGVGSPITKSGLSLAANTWYHLYLYRNGDSADIEISTTAPAEPYSGTARTKGGDNSRRYIGSVRTDGAGSIFNFVHVGNQITYRVDAGSPPFSVMSGGSATSPTSVSCSSVAPLTARLAQVTASNLSNVGMRILESEGNYGASGRIYGLAAGAIASVPVPLNASREFIYYMTGASTGYTKIELTGYIFER